MSIDTDLDHFDALTAFGSQPAAIEDGASTELLDKYLPMRTGEVVTSTASSVRSDPLSGFVEFQIANWDGDAAEPISDMTMAIARSLLEDMIPDSAEADAAPGGDGSIGFEWWFGARRIFIDVGPGDRVRTYFNPATNAEVRLEDEYRWGDSRLRTRLQELFNRLYQRSAGAGDLSRPSGANTYWVILGSEAATQRQTEISGLESLPTVAT